MAIKIVEESADSLALHGEISIAFSVKSRLVLESVHNGLVGIIFAEDQVDPPYLKDYYAYGPGRRQIGRRVGMLVAGGSTRPSTANDALDVRS